jgi:hypothetical protein
MTRRVLVAWVLAIAVALIPPVATAHEGHRHGTKAKKVKKTKPKKAAIAFSLARRVV